MNRLQRLMQEQGLSEDAARARLERQWVSDAPSTPLDDYLSELADDDEWQAAGETLGMPTKSEDTRGALQKAGDFARGLGSEISSIGEQLPETRGRFTEAVSEKVGDAVDWFRNLTPEKLAESAKTALREGLAGGVQSAMENPFGIQVGKAAGALATAAPIKSAHAAQGDDEDVPPDWQGTYLKDAAKRRNPDFSFSNDEWVKDVQGVVESIRASDKLDGADKDNLLQFTGMTPAQRESMYEQRPELKPYFAHLMRQVPETRGLDRPFGTITLADTVKELGAGGVDVVARHYAVKEAEVPEIQYREYLYHKKKHPDWSEEKLREVARFAANTRNWYNAITRPLAAELDINLSEEALGLAERIRETMTPQAQYEREQGFASEDAVWYDPSTWVDEHSALGNWQGFTMKMAENAANIGASILAARGGGKAGALSVTRGPRAKAAFETLMKTNPAAARAMLQQSAGRGGVVGGGMMEAKLIKDAAQSGIYTELMDIPDEVWDEGNSGRQLKKLMAEGLTRDEAKQVIASERARWGGNLAATLAVPFGAPAGYLFGRAGAGGALGQSTARQMLTAGATEAATEGLQEWLETLSENITKHSVDPEQSLLEGGLEAWLGGAALGGTYGALGGHPGRATAERKLAMSSPAAAKYLQSTIVRGELQNKLSNPEAIKNLSGQQRLENIYKLEEAELAESRAFLKAEDALHDWAAKLPEGERAEAQRRVRMMTGKHKAQIALIEAEQATRDKSRQTLGDQMSEVERRARATKKVEASIALGEKVGSTIEAIEKVQKGTALNEEEAKRLVDGKYARVADDGTIMLLPKARRELPNLRDAATRLQSMADPAAISKERRAQLDLRKEIDDMSPEQRERALYRSDVTGLKNKRAFKRDIDKDPPGAVAAIDADSLKWVNDNLGHEAGDKLLKKIGRALEQEGLATYHVSGDEFVMTGPNAAEIEEAMQRVVERIERYDPVSVDGVKVRPRLTWGIDTDYGSADAKAAAMKVKREAEGKRAKREKPPIGAEFPPGWKPRKPDDTDRKGPPPAAAGVKVKKAEPKAELTDADGGDLKLMRGKPRRQVIDLPGGVRITLSGPTPPLQTEPADTVKWVQAQLGNLFDGQFADLLNEHRSPGDPRYSGAYIARLKRGQIEMTAERAERFAHAASKVTGIKRKDILYALTHTKGDEKPRAKVVLKKAATKRRGPTTVSPAIQAVNRVMDKTYSSWRNLSREQRIKTLRLARRESGLRGEDRAYLSRIISYYEADVPVSTQPGLRLMKSAAAGQVLKDIRAEMGLSLQRFGDKIARTGGEEAGAYRHPAYLSRVETGKLNLTPRLAELVAKATGIPRHEQMLLQAIEEGEKAEAAAAADRAKSIKSKGLKIPAAVRGGKVIKFIRGELGMSLNQFSQALDDTTGGDVNLDQSHLSRIENNHSTMRATTAERFAKGASELTGIPASDIVTAITSAPSVWVVPAVAAVNTAMGDRRWSGLNKSERIAVLKQAAKDKSLDKNDAAYLDRMLRHYEAKESPIDAQFGLRLKVDEAVEDQRERMLDQFIDENVDFKVNELIDEFNWKNIDYDGYALNESHPDYQTLLDEQGIGAADEWLDNARAEAEPTVREILHRDAVSVLTDIFNGLDIPVEPTVMDDINQVSMSLDEYMDSSIDDAMAELRKNTDWNGYSFRGAPLNEQHYAFKEIVRSENLEEAQRWLEETREWEIWENAQAMLEDRWIDSTSGQYLLPPFMSTLAEFMSSPPPKKRKKKIVAGQKRRTKQKKAKRQPDDVEQWGRRAGPRLNESDMRQMRRYVSELAAEMGLPPNFVKVVNTANELSRNHKLQLMRMRITPTEMAGFFDEEVPSNGVHIIASYNKRATPAETRKQLAEVFYHEVVGHFGLRGVIGTEAEMDQWMAAIRAAFPEEVARMKYPAPVQAEEFVAWLAGQYLSGKKPHNTPEQRTVWEKFVAWVRGWLIKHGFGRYAKGPFKLTDHDVIRLIYSAADAARHFDDWSFKAKTGQSKYPFRMMKDSDIFTSSLLRDIGTATRKANKAERKQLGVTELPVWPKEASPENYRTVLRNRMEGPVSRAEATLTTNAPTLSPNVQKESVSGLEKWLDNFTYGSLRDIGLHPEQVVERMPPVARKRYERAMEVWREARTEGRRAVGIMETAKLFNAKPDKSFKLTKAELLKYVEMHTPRFSVEPFYPYEYDHTAVGNFLQLQDPTASATDLQSKLQAIMAEVDATGNIEEDGRMVIRNRNSLHQLGTRPESSGSDSSGPIQMKAMAENRDIYEMTMPLSILSTSKAPVTGIGMDEDYNTPGLGTYHPPIKGAMYKFSGHIGHQPAQHADQNFRSMTSWRSVSEAVMYVSDVTDSEVTFRVLGASLPSILKSNADSGGQLFMGPHSKMSQYASIAVRRYQYASYVPVGSSPGMYQIFGLKMEYRDRTYFNYRGHFSESGVRTPNKFLHIRSTVSMQADPAGPAFKPEMRGLAYHGIEFQSENLQKRFSTWNMDTRSNKGYEFISNSYQLNKEGEFRLKLSDYMMQDITDSIMNEIMTSAAKAARLSAQQKAMHDAENVYLHMLADQEGVAVHQLEAGNIGSLIARNQLPAPQATQSGELVREDGQQKRGLPALTEHNMEQFKARLPQIGADAAHRALGAMRNDLSRGVNEIMQRSSLVNQRNIPTTDVRLMDAFAAESLHRWGRFVEQRLDNAFEQAAQPQTRVETLEDVKTLMDDMLSNVFTRINAPSTSLVAAMDTPGRAGRLTIEPEAISELAEEMSKVSGNEVLTKDRAKEIFKDIEKRATVFTFTAAGQLPQTGVLKQEYRDMDYVERLITVALENQLKIPVEVNFHQEQVDVPKTHTISGKDKQGNTVTREVAYAEVETRDLLTVRVAGRDTDEQFLSRRISAIVNDAINKMVSHEQDAKHREATAGTVAAQPQQVSTEPVAGAPDGVSRVWGNLFYLRNVEMMFTRDDGAMDAAARMDEVFEDVFPDEGDIDSYDGYDDVQSLQEYINDNFSSEMDEYIENYDWDSHEYQGHDLDENHPVFEGIADVQGHDAAREWLDNARASEESNVRDNSEDYVRQLLEENWNEESFTVREGKLDIRSINEAGWGTVNVALVSINGPNSGEAGVFVDDMQIGTTPTYRWSDTQRNALELLIEYARDNDLELRHYNENPLYVTTSAVSRPWEAVQAQEPQPVRSTPSLQTGVAARVVEASATRKAEQHASEMRKQWNWMANFQTEEKMPFGSFKRFLDSSLRMTRMAGEMQGMEMPIDMEQAMKGMAKFMIADAIRLGLSEVVWNTADASASRGGMGAGTFRTHITDKVKVTPFEYLSPISGRTKKAYKVEVDGLPTVSVQESDLPVSIGAQAARMALAMEQGFVPPVIPRIQVQPPPPLDESSLVIQGDAPTGFFLIEPSTGNVVLWRLSRADVEQTRTEILEAARQSSFYEALETIAPHQNWPGSAAHSQAQQESVAPPEPGVITAEMLGAEAINILQQRITPASHGGISHQGHLRGEGARKSYDIMVEKYFNDVLRPYGQQVEDKLQGIPASQQHDAMNTDLAAFLNMSVTPEFTAQYGEIDIIQQPGLNPRFFVRSSVAGMLGLDMHPTGFYNAQEAKDWVKSFVTRGGVKDPRIAAPVAAAKVRGFSVTQEMYEDFKDGTSFLMKGFNDPVLDEAAKRIGQARRRRTIAEVWSDFRINLHDRIQQGLFDRLHGIKRAMILTGQGNFPAEGNPYIQARMTTGLEAILRGAMEYGAPVYEDGVVVASTKVPGLLEILAPVSDMLDEWGMYMAGVRAKRLLLDGVLSLTPDEMAELREQSKLFPGATLEDRILSMMVAKGEVPAPDAPKMASMSRRDFLKAAGSMGISLAAPPGVSRTWPKVSAEAKKVAAQMYEVRHLMKMRNAFLTGEAPKKRAIEDRIKEVWILDDGPAREALAAEVEHDIELRRQSEELLREKRRQNAREKYEQQVAEQPVRKSLIDKVVKHGRERNFTPEMIQRMVAMGETFPVFKEVAANYAVFNKALLDFAEKAGILNADTRPLWEHADYVPFYRIMDDRMTGPLSNKIGIANQRKPVKRLKGGEAPLGDIIGNIMMNMVQLIDSANKNRAAMMAIDALNETGMVRRIPWGMTLKDGKLVPNATQEMIPMAQVKQVLIKAGIRPEDIPAEASKGLQSMMALHEPSGEGVLSILRDGKREYYYTEDRLLFDAMTQINAKQWGRWMNLFRAPKRLMTTMITLDPSFQVANFMRDTLSAYVVSRDHYNVLNGAVKGLMGSIGKSPVMRKMISAGAAFESGYINAYDPGSVHRKIRRHTEDLSTKVDVKTVLNTPRKLLEAYMDLSSSVENANRVAVYRAAKGAGKSDAQAAFESKDLMDFSMGGSWPLVQFLIQTVPFMGARLQGLHRLGRGFMENPVGFSMKGMLLSMAGLALYFAFRDDERYEDLPDWDKDIYFHFWVGDRHYRLPKPFEVGVIFNTIPERMFDLMYSKEDDAGKHLMKRFGFSLMETFAMNPIPQAVMPMTEAFFNYDSFRDGQIARDHEMQRLPEDQYRINTSPTMRELSKVLPSWLPDKMRSPLFLEHVYHGYFASLGGYALRATDAAFANALSYPAKPEKTVRDYPVIGRFVRGDGPQRTRYEEQFYDLLSKTLQVKGSFNFAEARRDTDRLKEVRDEHAPFIRVAPKVDIFNRTISQYNSAMRQVWEHPTMSPVEKRQKIDDLQRSKNQLFKEAYKLRPGGEHNRLETPVTETDLSYLLEQFGTERLPEELGARMLPATKHVVEEVVGLSERDRQALSERP